jgi:organic radical activating enzyme
MDNNTNKQFRIYDKNGKYIRVSVDEAIARKLNAWQNWKCSAGVRNLYIDYDGNVWICNTASTFLERYNIADWEKYVSEMVIKNGDRTQEINNEGVLIVDPEWPEKEKQYMKSHQKTINAFKKKIPNNEETKQKYMGFLGNIFDGFDLPKSWVTCPWNSCGCGADVVLSKAKEDHNKELLAVTNHSWKGRDATAKNLVDTILDPVAVEMNFQIPYQILWDLGRRCNYDCSYCWPAVHNRVEEHKDFDTLINTVDYIIDNWSKGKSIRWNFGGGEPTLHPRFLDLLKHLKQRNQWTMVTSNGTRDYRYWSEAVKYLNSINLSAHFDGLRDDNDEDRFIRNIESICNYFNDSNDDLWLEIKLMAPPHYVDRAVNLRNKIQSTTTINKPRNNGRIKGAISLVPIRGIEDSGKVVDYTEDQLKLFQNQ